MITWGQLAKSQTDPEKIEEAIKRLINEHNADPEAHLVEGGSLKSHKMSEIIDHLTRSIVAEKLQSSAQVAECVVAPEGGDYTTIQDALNAGKKRIYIKAGTYIIPSPGISLTSDNIELYGEDKESVILKAQGGTDQDFYVLNISAAVKGIVLKSLTIDANKDEQSGEEPSVGGILISGAVTDLLITDCKILNTASASGIYIASSGANNVKIINNFFDGITSYSGISNSASENLFTDNIFQNSYGGITSLGNDNIISNNLVKNCTFGIYLQGDRNLVLGNLCKSNSRVGINVSSGKHQLVVGNKCYLNGSTYKEPGIDIGSKVSDCSVVGNVCVGNYGPGIMTYASYRCTIIGNICALNGREGIRIRGSQFLTISGNSLYKNSQESPGTYSALLLDTVSTYYSRYNVISSNTIDATDSPYGIREADTNCNWNIYLGNVVRNASTANISTQGTNNDVAHNMTP